MVENIHLSADGLNTRPPSTLEANTNRRNGIKNFATGNSNLCERLARAKPFHYSISKRLKHVAAINELIQRFDNSFKALIDAQIAIAYLPSKMRRVLESTQTAQEHQCISRSVIIQNMDSMYHLSKKGNLDFICLLSDSLAECSIPFVYCLEDHAGQLVSNVLQRAFGEQDVRIGVEKNSFPFSLMQGIFSTACFPLHRGNLITGVLSLSAEPIYGHADAQSNCAVNVVCNNAPLSSLGAEEGEWHWVLSRNFAGPILVHSQQNCNRPLGRSGAVH